MKPSHTNIHQQPLEDPAARKPLVTVGIPYTDQGDILAGAVASVLNQTFTDWEMILYGDGPDTVTKTIAESFTDRRIRHYKSAVRGGLAAALNNISELASADTIARMDGDDLMHPERLEKQFAFIQSHPEVDVVGSSAYLIDEKSELVGLYKEPSLPSAAEDYLKSNSLTHPTVMGRREWFLANRYDESLLRAEDKELWLRTSPHSTFAKLDEPLLYYRVPREISWRRQSRDSSYDRKIMRSYSHLTERTDISRRLVKSYIKQGLVFALAQFGMLSLVYKNKYLGLAPSERSRASKALESALWGLDEPGAAVLAITVTYGKRLHLVEKTTRAALDAGAAKVLIVDNGMAFEESKAMEAKYAGSPHVDIEKLEVNEGSATGFHAGLEAALNSRFDYYLLLDDDNVIVRGEVQTLVAGLLEARRRGALAGVAAVREVDDRHKSIVRGLPAWLIYPPTGAFMYFDAWNFIAARMNILKRKRVTSSPQTIPTAPYGGLLTDRTTVAAIGLPEKAYGLYEDDTEWSSRIAQRGELFLEPNVVIHDLVGKHSEATEGWGPERLLCSESGTRVYFAVRNRVHWERSQTTGAFRKVRYRINRTIYIRFITWKAREIGATAALNSILAAVSAGEAGDLSVKLSDMAAPL